MTTITNSTKDREGEQDATKKTLETIIISHKQHYMGVYYHLGILDPSVHKHISTAIL